MSSQCSCFALLVLGVPLVYFPSSTSPPIITTIYLFTRTLHRALSHSFTSSRMLTIVLSFCREICFACEEELRKEFVKSTLSHDGGFVVVIAPENFSKNTLPCSELNGSTHTHTCSENSMYANECRLITSTRLRENATHRQRWTDISLPHSTHSHTHKHTHTVFRKHSAINFKECHNFSTTRKREEIC